MPQRQSPDTAMTTLRIVASGSVPVLHVSCRSLRSHRQSISMSGLSSTLAPELDDRWRRRTVTTSADAGTARWQCERVRFLRLASSVTFRWFPCHCFDHRSSHATAHNAGHDALRPAVPRTGRRDRGSKSRTASCRRPCSVVAVGICQTLTGKPEEDQRRAPARHNAVDRAGKTRAAQGSNANGASSNE